jgi:hypothetical protein
MAQKVTIQIFAALKTSKVTSVTLKVEAAGSSETSEYSTLYSTSTEAKTKAII